MMVNEPGFYPSQCYSNTSSNVIIAVWYMPLFLPFLVLLKLHVRRWSVHPLTWFLPFLVLLKRGAEIIVSHGTRDLCFYPSQCYSNTLFVSLLISSLPFVSTLLSATQTVIFSHSLSLAMRCFYPSQCYSNIVGRILYLACLVRFLPFSVLLKR